jgi:hypothetical protein
LALWNNDLARAIGIVSLAWVEFISSRSLLPNNQLCLFESLARDLCALSGAAFSFCSMPMPGVGQKLWLALAGIPLSKFCVKILEGLKRFCSCD